MGVGERMGTGEQCTEDGNKKWREQGVGVVRGGGGRRGRKPERPCVTKRERVGGWREEASERVWEKHGAPGSLCSRRGIR